MTLIRTVEAAVEPVTVNDVKAFLRITHDSEDAVISELIKTACEEVERETSLSLIHQSWRLILDSWPAGRPLYFRRNPVRSVIAVTVYDRDGVASIIPEHDYRLDMDSIPARLFLNNSAVLKKPLNGLEIDFTTGFSESGADVPALLKRAIFILVAHWYEFRGAFGAKDQPVSIPIEYRRLISSYKSPRLQ